MHCYPCTSYNPAQCIFELLMLLVKNKAYVKYSTSFNSEYSRSIIFDEYFTH